MSVVIETVAMLCSLRIGKIGSSKIDKAETDKLLTANNVSEKSARVTKVLFTNRDLKPINSVINKAKIIRDKYTLPWNDMGQRMLPCSVYTEFTTQMDVIKDDFIIAVRELQKEYPKILDAAKNRLNGMFDSSDYPATIEDRFRFDLDIEPMPKGDHLSQLNLPKDESARLAVERDKKNMEKLKATSAEVINRLLQNLIVLIMGTDGNGGLINPDARLHETAVNRVTEILEIAPQMNVLDNPELNELIDKVRDLIRPEQMDVKAMREDEECRKQTLDSAMDAVETIKNAMGGIV